MKLTVVLTWEDYVAYVLENTEGTTRRELVQEAGWRAIKLGLTRAGAVIMLAGEWFEGLVLNQWAVRGHADPMVLDREEREEKMRAREERKQKSAEKKRLNAIKRRKKAEEERRKAAERASIRTLDQFW